MSLALLGWFLFCWSLLFPETFLNVNQFVIDPVFYGLQDKYAAFERSGHKDKNLLGPSLSLSFYAHYCLSLFFSFSLCLSLFLSLSLSSSASLSFILMLFSSSPTVMITRPQSPTSN